MARVVDARSRKLEGKKANRMSFGDGDWCFSRFRWRETSRPSEQMTPCGAMTTIYAYLILRKMMKGSKIDSWE